MESLAHPRVGSSDHADLFAGTPFKTTGWAGYENHRQYDQRSSEQREKERSPKTHPPMGAAVTRKQAGDDVGENGYCHDLTATNSLSQVCYYEFTVTSSAVARLPAGLGGPSLPNIALCREALRRAPTASASARG
jgi:hypothetical protein